MISKTASPPKQKLHLPTPKEAKRLLYIFLFDLPLGRLNFAMQIDDIRTLAPIRPLQNTGPPLVTKAKKFKSPANAKNTFWNK